jgi:hypothetical protein
MRALLIPSSGFYAAAPAYNEAGEVYIALSAVVAFVPIYDSTDDDDPTFTSVQPLVKDWNGIENPCQLIKRPDGLYVDRYGKVGNEAAALRLFENANCSVRAQKIGTRYARYKANLLTVALSTGADGKIYIDD